MDAARRDRRARASFRWLAAGVALALAGCMTPPEKATVVQQPGTAPVRTVSSFTEALNCMDTLLWDHGKRDIFITSNGVPDATGRVAGGTKEMLITAVSRMSARSNAFRFVDFEPAMDDVNALYWLVGVQPDFRAPSYYIRGAVTQLDDNVLSEAAGAGISLPAIDIGVSRDQIVSVITVDLNVGELVTRQILPGMSASNSIAVVASGAGGSTGGIINKAGLSFNVSLNRSEGFHQALRTLIELSVIEVLGKLTRTPYWQCLGIEQTNPAFMAQARDWYDAMPAGERDRFVGRVLAAEGYLDAAPGAGGEPLRSAIGRYQADNGLIASGRVDFDLYYHMLGAPKTTALAPEQSGPGTAVPAPRAAPAVPDLILASDRGPRPRYRVGETVAITVQPTGDGYVYCFYEDGRQQVARIFPNRFQPDPFVEARRRVEIPPANQTAFNIRMDAPGATERVACIVSPQELGLHLPEPLKAGDLEAIPGVRLSDVLTAFGGLPGATLRSRELPIAVLPAVGG
ncbi:DUF4384 domain-containing protein [Arenibaculum sp.]|jgi:curli biogenesis system outer membrane secretion channel CsgG|uniref:DUF4384 domain-containing protein n=1 Tax=Arenibaculum sp. TaxID=2865862 RepID=UPI002E12E594|nr:DUF4384 domain-containing protein [Arenibaculum sp.]